MSQSTLITIVLAVIIIIIFLVDYFKNIKKDPIEEGIKEFVEKEAGKKSWYQTNKLFWLLPVSYILSLLFVFLTFVTQDKFFGEQFNLDRTKEVTHSDFDKIYKSYLNHQITITNIDFINKNYENIYFIETSNITALDKLELHNYEINKNYKAFDLLQKKLNEKEKLNSYKLYLDESIPLISNDLFDMYMDRLQINMFEQNKKEFRRNDVSSIHPAYNFTLTYLEDGKWEYYEIKYYYIGGKVEKEKKTCSSLKEYARIKTSIYKRNENRRYNDITYSEVNRLSNYYFFDEHYISSSIKPLQIPPYHNIKQDLSNRNFFYLIKIKFNRIFHAGIPFALLPFLLFFKLFFLVGGVNWFLMRKKNIYMFLFLLFFLSYLLHSLELIQSLGYLEHLILLIPMMSFFAWFINDKIKAQ